MLRALDDLSLEQPIAHQQSRGDRGLDRLFVLAADHQAVHDRVHVPDLRFVEFDLFGDVHRLAVDDQLPATLLPRVGQDEIELLAVHLEQRRAQLDLRALRERQDGLQDLARRPARCRLAGARAARLADGCEKQVQIAGDIGHGADGRARVAADRLLLDGDHGRQAEDEIHVRLGDLGDEPLRVARQRLHVPPLPLGVEGVERQARLARAGEPCDDDELVARDLDRDVLEVVHARSLHGDGCARRGPGWVPPGG